MDFRCQFDYLAANLPSASSGCLVVYCVYWPAGMSSLPGPAGSVGADCLSVMGGVAMWEDGHQIWEDSLPGVPAILGGQDCTSRAR